MNARITALATVLDIVVLVGLGLGFFFAPLTLMWAFQDDFSTDLLLSWAASVDIWMLGHGVPLVFTLPPELADSLALGSLSSSFTVDVALLGLGVLSVLWGYRIGSRESTKRYPLLVWFLAVGTMAGLSFAMVFFLPEHVVAIGMMDAVVRPALFLATGLAIATWAGPDAAGTSALDAALPKGLSTVVRAGFAAGLGSVVALVGAAALVVAGLLVVSFSRVISLYEALQPGALGIVSLSIAQLVLLPTLIVWALSWMVGPGFTLGAGALVSPLGTNLQAVPALPLLGIVPNEVPEFAFAIVVLPVVIAFIAGLVVFRRVVGSTGHRVWHDMSTTSFFAQPLIQLVGAAVFAGAVAAGFAGLLAELASGQMGPGRFVLVGPSPEAVALWCGVEVLMGVLLGSFAAALTRSSQRTSR